MITDTTIDYNLIFNSDNDWSAKVGESNSIYNSLSTFQNDTGKCSGCLDTDPMFVDGANNNFNLEVGSPASENALNDPWVYTTFQNLYGLDIRKDINGTPRPFGLNWDIGAFEGISASGNWNVFSVQNSIGPIPGPSVIDWHKDDYGPLNAGEYLKINGIFYYVVDSGNDSVSPSWNGPDYNFADLQQCDQYFGTPLTDPAFPTNLLMAVMTNMEGSAIEYFPSWITPDPSGDVDGDGIDNGVDNCPSTDNFDQADCDSDDIGDMCDNDYNPDDVDCDAVIDAQDNCPSIANNDQANQDGDAVGDVCDNCINTPNTPQLDSDQDNIGDACDFCFTAVPIHIVDGSDYWQGLQWVYDLTPASPFTVQVQSFFVDGPLVLDQGKDVTIAGGFNCDFTDNSGAATVIESLTIAGLKGSVTVDNLVIGPPPRLPLGE